jgi:nucleoside-diphosphate-sugar epimerase
MQILLTGASGFLGKNLIQYFADSDINLLPLKARWEQIDDLVLDETAEGIIHAAGIAHDLQGRYAIKDYDHANTQLSLALIDKFLQSKLKDFIFISSVKAIADTTEEIINEQTQPNPTTPYGISKRRAEAYIENLVLPPGKRIFILQPTLIYGKASKGNMQSLLHFVKKKLPYPFANYHNQRSFLNVNNFAFIIEQILRQRTIKGGRYLIADDEALSTVDLIQIIAEELGIRPNLIKVPAMLINTLASIGSVLKLPLNKQKVSKITENYVVSNQKIKSALAIEKMPFTIADGVKDMIDSLPKNQ